MNLTIISVTWIIIFLILIDGVFISLLFFNKYKQKTGTSKSRKLKNFIIEEIDNLQQLEELNKNNIPSDQFENLKNNINHKWEKIETTRNKKNLLDQYINILQSGSPNDIIKKKFIKLFIDHKIEKMFIKRLRSIIKSRRIESAAYLSYFPTEKSRIALESALMIEKKLLVKLYLSHALTRIRDEKSIPVIVGTLFEAPAWYQEKIQILLLEFGKKFLDYIPKIIDGNKIEIQKLLISFASNYAAEDLKEYLIKLSDSNNNDLALDAVKGLSKLYYTELNNPRYLNHQDYNIRNNAIQAMSNIINENNLNGLFKYLTDPDSEKFAVSAISEILRKEPRFISGIIKRYYSEQDAQLKRSIINILSNRIEYFLLKLLSKDKAEIRLLLIEILLNKKTSEIIGFLNKNKNIEIENEILSIVKDVIKIDEEVKNELSTYLNERMIKKLKLEKIEITASKKEEKKEKGKILLLYLMLIFLITIFPVIYILKYYNTLFSINIFDQLKTYILDLNYYLIYYSTSINLIYFVILIFSFIGVISQIKAWKIKRISFLFKKKLLPAISIVAPAYCEESTIIESANSLLNLKYPDYELIVVNDGSKDQTLNTLINYFNLEKVDIVIEKKLETRPIRGIYLNKSIPKLIVVDKANGGKADSLNAGINVSSKDFFCGIDADSLLEPDALLKIAALSLDTEKESVAMGGNIFPINGCSVHKGVLNKIGIPKNRIARFQTIEYLRAFMAGRIGWAYLNCLLIISGAFGLFKKNRVIQMGGYLTSSGKYKKDTVGEDMELVVRLSRYMREKKLKHKIDYSFNANCWTEVPEDYNILHKQRDRWHRGLIDIITFHKDIVFNWRYGSMGLISIPYFLIFEIAGPLVEIQGYLMVILAAVFGMMNLTLALLLFISTIMLGMFISITSLLITEMEISYFSFREIMILVYYAIIENFGFRQVLSFIRVSGYFSSMKKPKGWGKMVRKGFSTK